jgi:hypothetical protein
MPPQWQENMEALYAQPALTAFGAFIEEKWRRVQRKK